MLNAPEIALIIGITAFVVLIIVIVLSTLATRPKTPVERPREGLLPPLHGGYRALPAGQGRKPHPNPPKAPTGSGGGSH